MKSFNLKRKVLVFAPHPDDETLGCSGLLLKLKKNGSNLNWLLFTEMTKDGGYDVSDIKAKRIQIEKVKKIYKFKKTYELGYNPGSLDEVSSSEIIAKIKKILSDLKPDTILIPHHADIHTDHQVAHKLIISSSKSFRSKYIKTIMSYETLSETEFTSSSRENVFLPNIYFDISPFIEKKIEIMKIYKNEIMKHPYPRSISSIKAQARLRGSRIGSSYAEAFSLLQDIN